MSTSIVDPYYSSGTFCELSSGSLDAAYKVAQLKPLLAKWCAERGQRIDRVADVGCGSGRTTFLLRDMLAALNPEVKIVGYDVHPSVAGYVGDASVRFVRADFSQSLVESRETFDLVVLFDVIEHIPAPVDFLSRISEKCRLVALHIPLDDCLMCNLRNLARVKLRHPGHLLVLDLSSALNLVAFAGLRIVEYRFSPAFRAPSGRRTRKQQFLNPFREIIYRMSPYLVSISLGGTSLMVLARSARDLRAEFSV